jgi:hypothetical protein
MPKRAVGAAGEAAAAAGGWWEELGRCSSDSDPVEPSPAGGVAQGAGEVVWGLEEATAGNPGGGPVIEGPRTGVGGVLVEEKRVMVERAPSQG